MPESITFRRFDQPTVAGCPVFRKRGRGRLAYLTGAALEICDHRERSTGAARR